VPPEVRDAARGMGYSRAAMLWRIELPLALPSIMTGLRIATVSTVALVTVCAIVGYGGFGTVMVNGFYTNYYKPQIMTGALGCVGLALIFDLALIGLVGWSCRGRGGGAGSDEHLRAGPGVAQRPAELDQSRRHPGPHGRAPVDLAGRGGDRRRGRRADRRVARSQPGRGGGLVVAVANLTRAIPTIAL
jgi:ABC-type proline/glycine betaine transport system permease subunit